MSDLLRSSWWETSAFGSSSADSYANDGWEDLEGDLEQFVGVSPSMVSS